MNEITVDRIKKTGYLVLETAPNSQGEATKADLLLYNSHSRICSCASASTEMEMVTILLGVEATPSHGSKPQCIV